MDCRITCSTKTKRPIRLAAFTLVELLIASGVSSLVMIVLASLTLYSSQHFAFLTDQVSLQAKSLQMTDQFIKDARQARRVVTATQNELTLDHGASTVTYKYEPSQKQLTRQAGLGTPRTMLTDVEQVKFSGFQRTPKKGAFQPYDISTTNEMKVVYCSWTCAKEKPGGGKKSVRESQTAKAVLRTN